MTNTVITQRELAIDAAYAGKQIDSTVYGMAKTAIEENRRLSQRWDQIANDAVNEAAYGFGQAWYAGASMTGIGGAIDLAWRGYNGDLHAVDTLAILPLAGALGRVGKIGVAAEAASIRGLGSSPYATNGDLVQSIATRSDNWGIRNGLGNGPVPGTLKHGYAERVLNRYQRMFGDRGLTAEARYVGGTPWQSGMPVSGSIKLDVVEGPLTNPTQVWDYKFGRATLSQSRVTQIRNSIPNGVNVPIRMVKP